MKLCEVNHYQDCSNYSPGVKICPAPGVIDFYYVHEVKNKKNNSCLKVQDKELWCLLCNIIYRSCTKFAQIFPLVSKLALPRGIDSHYVHILKTETKTNVFWIGESYSLDIWHEMLFGGPVSRLFWIKPLSQNFALPNLGQWPTFLSFDVQQWKFDHVHSFNCKIELWYQVT
jgi:hypothetical protein